MKRVVPPSMNITAADAIARGVSVPARVCGLHVHILISVSSHNAKH